MSAHDNYRSTHTVREFRNKFTLIIGEVKTGKTVYMGEILVRFLEGGETDLTVIDMAPESTKGIGGKMDTSGIHAVRYYTAQILAPRLVGSSVSEILILAQRNAKLIEDLFLEYVKNLSKVLFINDISIYLQAGDLTKLLTFLHCTPTVIMNGYCGTSLGGGKLGERERNNMRVLQESCDRVIRL